MAFSARKVPGNAFLFKGEENAIDATWRLGPIGGAAYFYGGVNFTHRYRSQPSLFLALLIPGGLHSIDRFFCCEQKVVIRSLPLYPVQQNNFTLRSGILPAVLEE